MLTCGVTRAAQRAAVSRSGASSATAIGARVAHVRSILRRLCAVAGCLGDAARSCCLHGSLLRPAVSPRGPARRRRQAARCRAARSSSSSSRRIRAQADGSWKIAVPTLTIDAPARISSSASRPGQHAAHPDDRDIGQRLADLPDAAHGDRPDRRARTGRRSARPARAASCSVSITMPSSVLIIDRPSAPAATHDRAIATMSVTSGDSLANTGMSYLVAGADGGDHRAGGGRIAGEHLAAVLDVRAGDVHLDRGHPGRVGQPGGQLGVLLHRAARDRDHGPGAPGQQPGQVALQERVDARALQADRVEHAAAGLGHPRRRPPARGASITDLVTTAPILETSKNWASSRPELAQPDAVRIGLGSSTFPSLVRRSGAMTLPPPAAGGAARAARRPAAPRPPADCLRRWPRPDCRRRPAGRAAARRAAAPSRARRTRRTGSCRRRPSAPARRGTPARPTHDLHHPGDPVGADHRQHAGHADPDAAGHRLLDRDLHGQVVAAGPAP